MKAWAIWNHVPGGEGALELGNLVGWAVEPHLDAKFPMISHLGTSMLQILKRIEP